MASAFCSRDGAKARETAGRTIGGYFKSALKNYRYDDPKRFANVRGYEDYAQGVKAGESGGAFIPRPEEKMPAVDANQAAADAYTETAIVGTPDECIDKLKHLASLTQTDHVILLVNHAGCSYEETEESLRLLGTEVLPAVKAINAQPLAAASAV
jgi:alkanesulfonate monooxygenase SsuD/methylene tetrahydromethanopterin reductase-like flavin-dependent oxidoreductase (luciferase family)